MRPTIPLVLVLPVLAVLAPAQTFVVNAAGGGHFTDLPQAIAAVPGGAVLRVRPGVYSPFTLSNKSLRILGDDPASVVVNMQFSGITLGPTTAQQAIVIRDLRLEVAGVFLPPKLAITGAAGPVLLERVVFAPPPAYFFGSSAFTITGSKNVHLLHCTLAPPGATQGANEPGKLAITDSLVEVTACTITGGVGASIDRFLAHPGSPGISLERSFLHLVASQVTGGVGVDGGLRGFSIWYPGAGGPGVRANASVLHAVASTITGGTGGNVNAYLPMGGAGGDGLVATAGETRNVGATFAGGPGGVGTTGPGPSGQPTVLLAGAKLYEPGTPAPLAVMLGTPAPGQHVTFALLARPHDLALLAFGDAPALTPFPGLITTGTLHVLPIFTLGPFTIPATGRLDVPFQLATNWQLDRVVTFQFLTAPFGVPEIWASNLGTIVVKS